MPKREDETFINVTYHGHPPNCTCTICSELRMKKSSGEPIDEEESDWVSILKECPYCHKKSQMWNKKENKLGCMNIHCRKYYVRISLKSAACSG
jgi:hypothetical protein